MICYLRRLPSNTRLHLFRIVMLTSTVMPLILTSSQGASAAVLFNDTFANSTLNQTSNPSGGPPLNTTSYDIVSGSAATSSISPGDLSFTLPSSTSGFVEAQARFSNTLVRNSIELTITFTDTAGILTLGSQPTSQLAFGLFKSNSVAPKTNLQNSGLSSSLTSDATGGVQNWVGYSANIGFTGGGSALVYRPAQTGTTNTNQDLLFSYAQDYSQAYHNPAGQVLAGFASGPGCTLSAGSVYTADLKITLLTEHNQNAYDIEANLYSGNSVGGPSIGFGAGEPVLVDGFDSLAFGWHTANQFSQIDVQSITVQTFYNPGDVNLDGLVNQTDLNIITGNWLASGQTRATGDLNGDGLVNQTDLNLVTGNWLGSGGTSSFATVPEPAAGVLLLLGAIGFWVRFKSQPSTPAE